jgi:uncharacterized protein
MADSATSPERPARPRLPWWRVRFRVLLWPTGFYLTAMVVLMIFEETLIYFPDRYPIGEWSPVGVKVEDAWFEAADGTRLHGWYAPAENAPAVVLMAHGNAGNLSHRIDHIRRMNRSLGLSVMVFDYRGYGRSEGAPNEAGILADARAARKRLAERAGIAERDIVLLGESLGGGVMVDLAARDGARGLVLENTFTSLPDVAALHYPMFPVRLLMRNRLESIDKIADYHGPLLQTHGEADSIIPYQLGKRLFDAANQPKRLISLPRHDHNDPLPRVYYDALGEFIGTLPPVGKPL